MAHPHLTYFLLELATDSKKLAEYNGANKTEREKLGKDAHLSTKQSETLATADSTQIMTEVLAELGGNQDPVGGTHYTIQLALVLQPCKKHG